MNDFKFYKTKFGPAVILGREWAEERDKIDGLLKQECGNQATWKRIMAFGNIANNIYYLFKRGHTKFVFDHVKFEHDYGNVWKIVLENKVIVEEVVTDDGQLLLPI